MFWVVRIKLLIRNVFFGVIDIWRFLLRWRLCSCLLLSSRVLSKYGVGSSVGLVFCMGLQG